MGNLGPQQGWAEPGLCPNRTRLNKQYEAEVIGYGSKEESKSSSEKENRC